jgi:hypothetical protein
MDLVYCSSCGLVFIKKLIIKHYYSKRAKGEYMCSSCGNSHESENQVFKDIVKTIEIENETF